MFQKILPNEYFFLFSINRYKEKTLKHFMAMMDKIDEMSIIDIIEAADNAYIKYQSSHGEEDLVRLTNLLNPWLFELIYNVVLDEDKAEMILINAWTKLLEERNRINIKKAHIAYSVFRIIKNQEKFWN